MPRSCGTFSPQLGQTQLPPGPARRAPPIRPLRPPPALLPRPPPCPMPIPLFMIRSSSNKLRIHPPWRRLRPRHPGMANALPSSSPLPQASISSRRSPVTNEITWMPFAAINPWRCLEIAPQIRASIPSSRRRVTRCSGGSSPRNSRVSRTISPALVSTTWSCPATSKTGAIRSPHAENAAFGIQDPECTRAVFQGTRRARTMLDRRYTSDRSGYVGRPAANSFIVNRLRRHRVGRSR
mgnify:FL=1